MSADPTVRLLYNLETGNYELENVNFPDQKVILTAEEACELPSGKHVQSFLIEKYKEKYCQ